MPKYVFELGITLAAGDDLDLQTLNDINTLLTRYVEDLLPHFGKTRGRISAEAPFEQVTGGWLPPDENGVSKASSESAPIDYDPEPGTIP
jgi:hypothetical protein